MSEQFRKNLDEVVPPRNPEAWQTGKKYVKHYGHRASQVMAGGTASPGS